MNTFTKYPHLFSPLKIGKLELKNRIEIPPMGINLGRADGYLTAEYYLWVTRLARSGAGLVTVSDAGIDFGLSGGNVAGPRVDSEDKVPGLSRMVDQIHRYNAAASIELTHYGVVANPALVRPLGSMLMSSSDIVWDVDGAPTLVAKEMTHAQIRQVIQGYCSAARLCRQAGFDMVMIHGAHGQLPAQFLSPHFNRRTDEYGGSPENRRRYPLEVLKAVREAVGDDMVIELRVSATEGIPGGLEFPESLAFMEKAQEYVDIMHVSQGSIFHLSARYTIPTYFREPHKPLNTGYSEIVKKHLHIPVAVVGMITTLQQAEEIIASGKADIVAMAKSFMADGDLVHKSLSGQADRVRPCTRCDLCGNANTWGTSMSCAVNPRCGIYGEIERVPERERKHVMVIGGGPAGMMAVQILQKRGHRASLYEKSGRLGGLLNDASLVPFKQLMGEYVEWDVRETMECGAAVHLNTEVTEEQTVRMATQFPYVHVATHGYFIGTMTEGTDLKPASYDESMSQNGLILAGANASMAADAFDPSGHDGILSAREISQLDLSNIRLIVLSACQSGEGYMTDDGVYGLQRGLKNAGVNAMVVSLWSVDDEATSILMQSFYSHLKTDDIHTAFHKARKELIATGKESSRKFDSKHMKVTHSEPSFDQPEYYNAFILIDII